MSLPLMLALTLVAHPPAPVRWSTTPHRVIAQLAEERLSPATRAAVRRLVGDTSLAEISNWADAVRSSRPNTSNWHYVNIPLADTVYRQRTHCPRGCILRALETQRGILRDRARPVAQRREALKYLVHLVGDLHNPMHTGDRGDRGGNDLVVWNGNRRTNLHAYWDSGLLNAAGRNEPQLLARLRAQLRNRRDLDSLAKGGFVEWAMASHDAARDVAYAYLPDDYRLGSAYVNRAMPVLEEQLLLAVVRLARILEESLPR